MPNEVPADNNFYSEANLEGLKACAVCGYLAVGRASKPGGGERRQAGSGRTRQTPKGRPAMPLPDLQIYRRTDLRTDQTSQRLGPYLVRSFDTVEADWAMICTKKLPAF